jgi:predicted ribosomally synthesized peptide with nif11-like leader
MSRDTATAFLVSLAADPNLKKELDAQLQGATDPVSSFVQFAGRKGKSFSPEDLAAALSLKDEISDQELAKIAGGLNPQPLPPRYLFDTWSWYGSYLQNAFLSMGLRR